MCDNIFFFTTDSHTIRSCAIDTDTTQNLWGSPVPPFLTSDRKPNRRDGVEFCISTPHHQLPLLPPVSPPPYYQLPLSLAYLTFIPTLRQP